MKLKTDYTTDCNTVITLMKPKLFYSITGIIMYEIILGSILYSFLILHQAVSMVEYVEKTGYLEPAHWSLWEFYSLAPFIIANLWVNLN